MENYFSLTKNREFYSQMFYYCGSIADRKTWSFVFLCRQDCKNITMLYVTNIDRFDARSECVTINKLN